MSMKVWHPWQLLNSTANSACFAWFLGEWATLAVLFSWRLQIGSQDFDFSLVLGAEYSFYVKSIATYALQKVAIMIHS